jgi:uncharacterized protein YcbK (DUF882 family)
VGLAALLLAAASGPTHNAIANGDTRTISFHHKHTGEDLTITYKVNGRYVPAAMKKIDWLMRDWRRDEAVKMDPHLIDVLWEVHREVGGGVIQVVCGYRAPKTNAQLRRRSSGVAENSQHTHGKAIDFYIEGADLTKLREAGLRLQRGGVGFYPGSGWPFVHMDVGSIRHWPRMTHDQLVKVFPDGRTVHIPSDGKPLKNYALALADVQKHGDAPSALYAQAARDAGIKGPAKRVTLASLFGFNKKDGDENEEADVPSAAQASSAAREPAKAPQAKPVQVAAIIPLPKTRPAAPAWAPIPAPVQQATFQVASAAPAVPAARPAPMPGVHTTAAVTPNDVINARGFWEGPPRVVALESAADPQASTGSVNANAGPWMRERAPGAFATAYASIGQANAGAGRAAAPMGNAVPRAAAIAAGTTIARKGTATQPSVIQNAFAALPARPAGDADLPATGRSGDGPWLRAVIATPSARAYLNTSLYGAVDYTALRPLLAQPKIVVMMDFSADPNAGLAYHQFSGQAVVFLATTRTVQQTAALN